MSTRVMLSEESNHQWISTEATKVNINQSTSRHRHQEHINIDIKSTSTSTSRAHQHRHQEHINHPIHQHTHAIDRPPPDTRCPDLDTHPRPPPGPQPRHILGPCGTLPLVVRREWSGDEQAGGVSDRQLCSEVMLHENTFRGPCVRAPVGGQCFARRNWRADVWLADRRAGG